MNLEDKYYVVGQVAIVGAIIAHDVFPKILLVIFAGVNFYGWYKVKRLGL